MNVIMIIEREDKEMMRDVNWKMIEEIKEGKITAKIVKEKGKKDRLYVTVNNHVFEWKGFWNLVGRKEN